MKVKSESEIAQSCLTLRDPMDCSPPGSSIHGILQAKVLEWGTIAFSESRLYQALISITTQADTYPLFFFFFLGTEALPREVPWGALGHRHTGDEREGDPRMHCEGTWSEMCTDKEPIQYGSWKGWESLHPSGGTTSSFPDASQNLDVQMRKQMKEMLLSSNAV